MLQNIPPVEQNPAYLEQGLRGNTNEVIYNGRSYKKLSKVLLFSACIFSCLPTIAILTGIWTSPPTNNTKFFFAACVISAVLLGSIGLILQKPHQTEYYDPYSLPSRRYR